MLVRIVLVACVLTTSLSAQSPIVTRGSVPVFGRIADAKIMSDDRVVVVDESDPRVWYLDADSRVVATAGRNGSGPGEFRLPERLVRMDDSTLGVIDRPNARLNLIRVRRDTILALGTVPMHPTVENACRLRGALLLAQPDPASGSRVTAATPAGVVRGRLAPVAYEGSPAMRETHAQSVLGCLPASNQFVLASVHFPTVTAFDATGRERRQSVLPSWRQVSISDHDGGRRFLYRLEGNNEARAVIPIGVDTIVVAVHVFWVGPPKDSATIIGARYDLDARTGRVLRYSEGPDRLLDVRLAMEVVMVEDPEPAVIFRRRQH